MYNVIVCGCKTDNEKLGIGLNQNIPWNLKEDMIHFKNITTGGIVFMGYKTWLSIPIKPLNNRINIVLTNKNIDTLSKYENTYYVNSIEDGITLYTDEFRDKKLFIIGGESLYDLIIKKYPNNLDKLILTRIFNEFKCDSFFNIKEYMKIKNEMTFQTPGLAGINEKTKETIHYKIEVYSYK